MRETQCDLSINRINSNTFRLDSSSNQGEQQNSNHMLRNHDKMFKQYLKKRNSSMSRTFSNPTSLEYFQSALQKRMREKDNKKKGSKFGTVLHDKSSAIANYRQRNIQRQFISRLTRNSVFRKPVQFEQYSLHSKSSQHGINGIMVNETLANFLEILKILTTIFSILVASLIVPFYSTFNSGYFYMVYSYCGSVYTMFQIFMGFTFVRKQEQNKKTTLLQISKAYLHGNFIVDLLCFLVFFICAVTTLSNMSSLYIIFVIKIPECLRKINEVETKVISTFTTQNYVKLLKLIVCNFTFAHFIAIVMLMMSHFGQAQSWIQKSHFADKWWFQQYSWAYYWAMTTMLSVGFGDITVANYKEALVLTIIQAVGCITIGYNVSSVIGLINSLEEKQLQKNRSITLLRKIKEKNQIQTGIYKEITNFIKQSDEMDAKFNRQPLANLIEKLPQNLQKGFLRSVNEKSIKNLPFFRHLHTKSLALIAQKICTKVAHPEQILIQKEEMYNKILILKQGEIGLFPWLEGKTEVYSKLQQFDKFIVKEGEPSKILNLNFLRPFYRTKNYQYKPIKYCLLLQTDLRELREILKSESADFQMYFQYRDKDCGALEEYQVLDCQICKEQLKNRSVDMKDMECLKQRPEKTIEKHFKIECPRFHYCPISQQVIMKYLRLMKTDKVKRKKLCSLKIVSKVQICGLKQYRNIIREYKQFIDVESLNIDDKAEASKDCQRLEIGKKSQSEDPSQLPNNIINYCLQNKANQWMEVSMGGGYILKQSTIRKKVTHMLPNFWNIECDKAHDFKFYFTGSNPKKICREPSNCSLSNKRYSFFHTFM